MQINWFATFENKFGNMEPKIYKGYDRIHN
jgi:hypothetical protein